MDYLCAAKAENAELAPLVADVDRNSRNFADSTLSPQSTNSETRTAPHGSSALLPKPYHPIVLRPRSEIKSSISAAHPAPPITPILSLQVLFKPSKWHPPTQPPALSDVSFHRIDSHVRCSIPHHTPNNLLSFHRQVFFLNAERAANGNEWVIKAVSTRIAAMHFMGIGLATNYLQVGWAGVVSLEG